MFVKTDNPMFVKHVATKAVVSCDSTGLQGYRKRRDLMQTQKTRISKLEADVADLKAMLTTLMRSR